MITIEYAKNPVYINQEGTSIQLIVKFEEFNNEMPFAATTWDPEPWGIELYNRAIAGEFGPIAPYVPPPEPEQLATTGTQEV